MKVGKFHGVPLHVVAGGLPVPANPIGVNRSLIPVKVHDHVAQRGGSGGGEGLTRPSGGEPPFTFNDVQLGGVRPVIINGPECQPQRGGHPYSGCPGGQPDERGRRRRVPVERLRPELLEERRPGHRIAPEAQEVLEAELITLVVRQQLRRGGPDNLVSQRPQCVYAERLVPRCVGDHVRIKAVRIGKVIIHCVEQQGRHEPPGGDRAPGVPGHGNVVVEDCARAPINQVERLEVGQVLGGQRRPPRPDFIRDLNADRPSRSHLPRHSVSLAKNLSVMKYPPIRRSSRSSLSIGGGPPRQTLQTPVCRAQLGLYAPAPREDRPARWQRTPAGNVALPI